MARGDLSTRIAHLRHHHRPEYVANSEVICAETNSSMSLKEVMTMLAFDPFLRDFDRLTQQLLAARWVP
ncbi:hypothetical protein I553_1257 [Mycobacterium xenopi 4042]|uniref:Uncharacterized protein n=1 Tax=Mycobacterium xenopi 4042 TaxID=1299334 RepID=X7Z9W1_MYCXE|nr:hypothetical protein I553_1257 [Mycobacterium xenopi 4042]